MKVLFLLILIIPLQLHAPGYSEALKQARINIVLKKAADVLLYETVLEDIRRLEALRLQVYICPAGQRTIGYGHLLTEGESYQSISKEKADSLLKKDFEIGMQYTGEEIPYHKRLAISHFIFNVGQGNYASSNLKQFVDDKRPIDTEIIKWQCYHSKGVLIKSKVLLKARLFELKLYNYEDHSNNR